MKNAFVKFIPSSHTDQLFTVERNIKLNVSTIRFNCGLSVYLMNFHVSLINTFTSIQ